LEVFFCLKEGLNGESTFGIIDQQTMFHNDYSQNSVVK